MKIRTKISLVTIGILLFSTVITVSIAVLSIKAKGRADIERYRSEELARIKRGLKNFVDIAYETISTNYGITRNEDFLKKYYGRHLKDMVGMAYDTVNTNYYETLDRRSLEKTYGKRLKDIIDVAESTLRENASLAAQGKLTQTEAKKRALSSLKRLRYNSSGYVWINDRGLPYPKMIMHTTIPELDGKVLDAPEFNCALGKGQNLFQAFVEVCNEKGEGFVDYLWPKPTKQGLIADMPKLSYVRLFKEWNWIIGTGVYIDGIDKMIDQKEKAMNSHVNRLITRIVMISILALFCAIFLSFFFANSLAGPIRNLIGTMRQVKLDALSSSKVSLEGTEEIRELGGIFNHMIESLDDAVIRLEETTAAKERIESELSVARDIQMSILPKLFPAFPERPEFDVYAKLESAKAVGGDLYDFFFIDDDHLCFAIGDVSGKGVPSSLFMAVARTILKAKAVKGLNAGEIITGMNNDLCPDNEMSMFVTLFMCILDIRSGELEFCNAGHNPPYIIRHEQGLERVESRHGLPLGVMGGVPYSSEKLVMQPGDRIILYTDGVTEAEDMEGRFFTENKLGRFLEMNRTLSAEGLTEKLLQEVKDFAGDAEQADDITILVLNYRSVSQDPPA